MNYTIVINGFVWFGCMIYYFLFARQWYTGPQTTIDESDSASSGNVMINSVFPASHIDGPTAAGRKND